MADNAVGVVLNIPELLDTILRKSDYATLVSCARVCQKWEIPALRIIWEERCSPRDLFALLGELYMDGPIRFKEGPIQDQWPRFRRCANLVRDFRWSIGPGDEVDSMSKNTLSPHALLEVFALALTSNETILPNATYVCVMPRDDESAIASTALLQDTIRTLTLAWHIGSATDESLHPALRCIRVRCSQLTNLTIEFGGAFRDIPEVVETLASLPRLECASLPSSFISDERVWEALGNLSRLRALGASDDHATRVLRMTLDDVRPPLAFDDRDKFLPLAELDMFLPVSKAIALFASSPPRDTISKVALRVHNARDSPCTMWGLISAIPRKVPRLKSLCIASYVQDMRIKLDDITPLFSVHSLRVLRICTHLAAPLTDDHYAKLAASLPQIQVLEIAPAPMELTPPPATLLALSHVARHCQQIEELAVYVDTAIDRLPGTDVSLSVFTPTLKRINFGLSPVHSRRAIAYPLSRMLSHKVPEILGGEAWNIDMHEWWREEETRERLDRAYDDWATVRMVVQQLLPFVDAVRQDAPQRARPNA